MSSLSLNVAPPPENQPPPPLPNSQFFLIKRGRSFLSALNSAARSVRPRAPLFTRLLLKEGTFRPLDMRREQPAFGLVSDCISFFYPWASPKKKHLLIAVFRILPPHEPFLLVHVDAPLSSSLPGKTRHSPCSRALKAAGPVLACANLFPF